MSLNCMIAVEIYAEEVMYYSVTSPVVYCIVEYSPSVVKFFSKHKEACIRWLTVYAWRIWQESLANAKVNARQHCVSLWCLVAWNKLNGWFSCCCLPNTRNNAKFRPNLTLQQFKVIDLGVNRKPVCDFLLVINRNFGRILHRFRDIAAQR